MGAGKRSRKGGKEMKVRVSFVSNSSTSSFIVVGRKLSGLSEEQEEGALRKMCDFVLGSYDQEADTEDLIYMLRDAGVYFCPGSSYDGPALVGKIPYEGYSTQLEVDLKKIEKAIAEVRDELPTLSEFGVSGEPVVFVVVETDH
jgi:hypothetical protein